ncbi:hypothetical protein [Lysinibacillus sp. 38-6]|uniref:hypothetical protein n=1 Tax=Lysinibacillus sp. 38-6 TaxID=3385991 RepID=UPI00390886F2
MLLVKVELQTNRQGNTSKQKEHQLHNECSIIAKALTEQQLEEMMQIIEEIRLNGYNIKM